MRDGCQCPPKQQMVSDANNDQPDANEIVEQYIADVKRHPEGPEGGKHQAG
jgi:hypothetical protein